MTENKILPADLSGKGVIGLNDVPALNTADMQAKFDELVTDVVAPKHNALIDDLEGTDEGEGADCVGFNAGDSGLSATNAGEAIRQTKTALNSAIIAAGNVPLGGTTGQSLKKNSNADRDLKWESTRSVFEKELTVAGWVGTTDSFTSSTTVTDGSVTLTEATFKEKVENATGEYVFTYDASGTVWKLSDVSVILSEYGIVLTGTPADTNTITVTYSLTAPFIQEVTVDGLSADDTPHVGLVLSDTKATAETENEESVKVNGGGTPSTGKLTLRCLDDKPTAALNIQVEVIR